jgi:ankyrin repeat protein
LACQYGQKEVAELILNFAKENSFISEMLFDKDNGGRTPLHWACEKCRKEVAELILNFANENSLIRAFHFRRIFEFRSPSLDRGFRYGENDADFFFKF